MLKFRFAAIAATAISLAPARGIAQNQPSIVESSARALAILDAAIAAHGGADALKSAQRIHVTLRGQDFWRNQSARVAPPYDARDAAVDFMVDLPASRLVSREISAYPGDLQVDRRRVIDSARAFRVFGLMGLHRIDRPTPIANQAPALFAHLPQLALFTAQENRASLRSLGSLRLASGAIVNAVSMNTATGPMTLGFDPQTKLLRALLDVRPDPLVGDAAVETEFVDYRPLGGVLLPGRRVSYVAGEKTQDLRYVAASADYKIPDSLLAIPSDSKVMVNSPPGEPVQELAPGVWSIGQFGSHVLVVAFTEYVVVVEAPQGITQEILAEVSKLAPGKPIRYVVPTHHHDDHSGGIRDYIAAGTTVVTTQRNRAYFERMAVAHSALDPDAQATTRRKPTFDIISNGRRVFTDGKRTLELHNVGPNAHAEELLVAWIPEAGILYEADMINTAPNGDVVKGSNMKALISFADSIKRRGWNVKLVTGMHHPPLPPSVIEEILAQPIRQP